MLASGFGSRANLYASSKRPSPMSATYRPALVWAGHAIMQGKLVFNQSLSTFLSLNRFSKMAISSAFSSRSIFSMKGSGQSRPLVRLLFAQRKISLGVAGYGDGLGLILGAFMPRAYRVTAVGNVFNFVTAAIVGFGKIGSWGDDNISLHFRMHIAEQRNHAHLIEGIGTLFALGPRSEIVSCFLVAGDRSPKDVVLHVVAIQELNGCALLHRHNVRSKDESLLIHNRVLFGSGKRFARNGVDVDYRLALHSRNFSLNIAGPRCDAQPGNQ